MNLENLVIGNTSQLSYYYPEDYIKISSRNIDMSYLEVNQWDSVYITFAEQRVHSQNESINYITPNYIYTLKIINSLIDNSNKICLFTSCELWNELTGTIYPDTAPKFLPLSHEYTISKLLLLNKIKELRQIDKRYDKVIFMHPFYFNSIHRSKYFLFGKIFDSIINKTKISVGNLNTYRDMVHPKLIVKTSIEKTVDCTVGAGKLFNVRNFVKDLYELNDMKFSEFVEEDLSIPPGKDKLIISEMNSYTYQNLLDDTMEDIIKFRGNK